jgi:hypothetical protein
MLAQPKTIYEQARQSGWHEYDVEEARRIAQSLIRCARSGQPIAEQLHRIMCMLGKGHTKLSGVRLAAMIGFSGYSINAWAQASYRWIDQMSEASITRFVRWFCLEDCDPCYFPHHGVDLSKHFLTAELAGIDPSLISMDEGQVAPMPPITIGDASAATDLIERELSTP